MRYQEDLLSWKIRKTKYLQLLPCQGCRNSRMREHCRRLPNQFKCMKESTECNRIPCCRDEIYATRELSHAHESLHSTVNSARS